MDDVVTKKRCNVLLTSIVGPELVDRWWKTPNLAFDGKPPLEADLDRVFSYLMSHAFGGEYY